VVVTGWALPGALDRASTALRPELFAPRVRPVPPVAQTAPPTIAPGVVPEGPMADPPVGGAIPEEIATPPVPAPPLPSGVPPYTPPAAGKLLIPVQGVLAGSLVDTYTQARGQNRRHDAIDIMAPRGTPVLAVADGAVMKLFTSVRGGTTLYQLAPDQRTIYYYAHLDGYAAGMTEGRELSRGEVLGYVGDTGDATPGGYHLHFEVSTTADPKKYWGGTPQNPFPLLR
jgi:peptidoglycan LD-endopeptidase LytH